MLRAIILERAIIFLTTLATIAQSTSTHSFDSKDLRVALHEQLSMMDRYKVTCARITEVISCVSQVFYPGMAGPFEPPM
jgi:hypothetical protein